MNPKNKLKNSASRFLLMFLILSQLSNAFLVTDLLDTKDKIVLNSDIDNSSKEDKNSLDSAEESKILVNYFHSIFFSNESNTIDYIVENFNEVSNTEDLPPPESNFQA
tara:strand:- start:190 stop:513 length:324 start_codon:yes stop_codon:yes gene_type:complete